jgi:hypothetical protein
MRFTGEFLKEHGGDAEFGRTRTKLRIPIPEPIGRDVRRPELRMIPPPPRFHPSAIHAQIAASVRS